MADRVAVIHQGRLAQFAPPNEVYDQPATLFVNQFVGASNTLRARMAGTASCDIGGVRWPVRTLGPSDGQDSLVCVRPEQLRIAGGAEGPALPGTIELSLPLGPQIVHEIRLHDGQDLKLVESRSHGAGLREPGSAVSVILAPGALPNAFTPPPEGARP